MGQQGEEEEGEEGGEGEEGKEGEEGYIKKAKDNTVVKKEKFRLLMLTD